jgi:hypothetical protein
VVPQQRRFREAKKTCSHKIEKTLMAPAVSTSRKKEKVALAMNAEQRRVMSEIKALTEKLRENADYVGNKFAEEARKIHFGETEPRGIYGEASTDEARSLADDGVPFMPLPVFPDEQN